MIPYEEHNMLLILFVSLTLAYLTNTLIYNYIHTSSHNASIRLVLSKDWNNKNINRNQNLKNIIITQLGNLLY